MTTIRMLILRLAPALALAAAATMPREAEAQKKRPPAPPEVVELDDDDERVDLLVVEQPVIVMDDANFDQLLFSELQNAAGARSRLDSLLALRIEHVAQACGLSDEQKQRLRLAGRGDIKRLFERADELRRNFQLVKADQGRMQEIFREAAPLHATFAAGPFGDSSIFVKALKNTLTSEQISVYETAARERRMFSYRAAVEIVVSRLDEFVSLRAAQRRQLQQILLDETRPPEQPGHDMFVVLVEAARLPEDKLRPVFDAVQWQFLTRYFEKIRQRVPFLEGRGLLPAPDDDTAAAPGGPLRAAPKMRVRPAALPAPGGF